jgi:hypothetical protein
LKALTDGKAKGNRVELGSGASDHRKRLGRGSEVRWGRDYDARGAMSGRGYRHDHRMGRVKSVEGAIEYSAPFRSRLRTIARTGLDQLRRLQ